MVGEVGFEPTTTGLTGRFVSAPDGGEQLVIDVVTTPRGLANIHLKDHVERMKVSLGR